MEREVINEDNSARAGSESVGISLEKNGHAALSYARNGWSVFPLYKPEDSGCSCGKLDCSKIGKHPRIVNWQKHPCSVKDVGAWWRDVSDANIGLRLDGLVVLDVDPKNGGFESLADLEAQYGILDPRALQRSGSGGWHYLFNVVQGVTVARGFRPGLDLLTGPGCYIVAEPSLHASGGHYKWTDEPHPLTSARDTIALTAPPQWLLEAATQRKPKPANRNPRPAAERVPIERLIAMVMDKVRAGEGRNNCGLFFFTQLRDNGYSRDEAVLQVRDFVSKANEALPGTDRYTLAEAQATLRSTYSRAPRDPWSQGEEGLTPELAKAIMADTYFARDAGGMLYCFVGGVYKPTGKRAVERRVKALCETLGKTKSWSPELAARVEQWIVTDAPELWESPPLDVLNCRNGLLDVATRTLRPHSPEHLSAVQIMASFDSAATCPAIDKFVRATFPGDTHALAWEIPGWLMLPHMSAQRAVLLIGEGANGKSVYLNLLLTFLGRENVSTLSLHRIEADKFAASRLVGKLANFGLDLPAATLSGTSTFKTLTGGDPITAERKFEPSFEFRPFARLVFSANSAPRSDDATHGFWRRWVVVPFDRTFSEQDPDHVPRAVLDARLTDPAELSGLLNRALDAIPVVQQGRFSESESTRAAFDEFRQVTDPLCVWLDANTVEAPEAWVLKEALRSAYADACREAGRSVMAEVPFTAALKRLRPKVQLTQRRVGDKRPRVFAGIGMRDLESGSLDQFSF